MDLQPHMLPLNGTKSLTWAQAERGFEVVNCSGLEAWGGRRMRTNGDGFPRGHRHDEEDAGGEGWSSEEGEPGASQPLGHSCGW